MHEIHDGFISTYNQAEWQARKNKKDAGKGTIAQNIADLIEEDETKYYTDKTIKGNIQLADMKNGLFVIFSAASVSNYLIWCQELPLMIGKMF
jgi:hypothetical protein